MKILGASDLCVIPKGMANKAVISTPSRRPPLPQEGYQKNKVPGVRRTVMKALPYSYPFDEAQKRVVNPSSEKKFHILVELGERLLKSDRR